MDQTTENGPEIVDPRAEQALKERERLAIYTLDKLEDHLAQRGETTRIAALQTSLMVAAHCHNRLIKEMLQATPEADEAIITFKVRLAAIMREVRSIEQAIRSDAAPRLIVLPGGLA